jgi:hypothetical protein
MAARATGVEAGMAYLHCPTCRVVVQDAAAECPRCGGSLVERLLPRALDPRAVRAALVKRGGRFRPPAPAGRFARAPRRDRAA